MNLCVQGTSVAPAFKVCLDSGQLIVIGVLLIVFGLFCMAVGAGMRKR